MAATQAHLEAALRMHHSKLEGRKINVELTAGGGGKSENRMNKIKSKNDEIGRRRQQLVKRSPAAREKPAGKTAAE